MKPYIVKEVGVGDPHDNDNAWRVCKDATIIAQFPFSKEGKAGAGEVAASLNAHALRKQMRAYVATNPARGKSWAQLFDDRSLYAEFQAWARAHPLHGRKIPLVNYISEVTRAGNTLRIMTVNALYLDHCGVDNWRFIGQYGNAHKRLGKRTYWITESMIDWEKL